MEPTDAPRPLVKWAGGKQRLLKELSSVFPKNTGFPFTRYVEPFVGGGSVLAWVLANCDVDDVVVIDKNPGLINMYKEVKDHSRIFKNMVAFYESEYKECSSDKERQDYYLKQRTAYNAPGLFGDPELFAFLNKTCFNGLYRVNSKGQFNSPFGHYDNPCIIDSDNVDAWNRLLNKPRSIEFICADFSTADGYVNDSTFVYLDPPYIPNGKGENFTEYTAGGFSMKDQCRLASYANRWARDGAYVVLSNSHFDQVFMDKFYPTFGRKVVQARRSINSDGKGRGPVDEMILWHVPVEYRCVYDNSGPIIYMHDEHAIPWDHVEVAGGERPAIVNQR